MTRTRPRSALFDTAEASMKRLTGFFGGSSSEGRQTPPPPLAIPPIPTFAETTPNTTDPAPTNGRSTPHLSISLPSPRKCGQENPLETLTPPVSGHNPYSSGVATAHLQPLPQSPATPVGGSRNFSGASYASYASHTSHASHASQMSYASNSSSRPASSYRIAGGSPLPPPTPTSPSTTPPPLDMPPRQLKKKTSSISGIFGRKKKYNADQPVAWRLAKSSTENLVPYDVNSLLKGDSVPDLWDTEGDTLVYLAPQNSVSPKYAAPFFRIRSSPLLFSALGSYIQDVQTYAQPGDVDSSDALTPNDLFLDVPSRKVSQTVTATASDMGSSITSDSQDSNADDSKVDGVDESGLITIPEQNEGRPGISASGESQDPTVMYKVYYPALELDALEKQTPAKSKKSKRNSVSDDNLVRLLDARNLFAFLGLEFLVAIQSRETIFQVFAKIFKQLQPPSTTREEDDHSYSSTASKIYMAESHLLHYIDELRMDDIRNDDDAIVEALIMGEQWRCQRLYTEGFIHACGRWDAIKGHPGFEAIASKTKARLDRASLDLHQTRISNVETRLTNFEFPSVWLGEGRYSEFKAWRNGYDAMRKHTISYYKHHFGSWPPKAGKHGKGGGYTETGGLNRIVLKRLYDDFAELYDLLVDREWIHGERIHFEANNVSDGDDVEEVTTKEERARTTMRKIMEEFDHSNIPIQPGIPFDLPRSPFLPPTPPPTADGKKKKKESRKPRSAKKLKSDELTSVLTQSYNSDVLQRQPMNPFLKSYMDLEKDFGSGKTVHEIAEGRRGRWIFMYCVMQSLPMTVVDAQALQHGNGVEYFLCENLKGSMPWDKTNRRESRMSGLWTPGPGGNFMASMTNLNIASDDDVDNTYRRSHCWVVAEEWRMVKGNEDDGIDFDGQSDSVAGTFEYGSQNGRNSAASQYSPQMVPNRTPSDADASLVQAALQDIPATGGYQKLQIPNSYSNVYSINPYLPQDNSRDYSPPQLSESYLPPRATFNTDFLQSPISPTQVSLPATPPDGTPISTSTNRYELPPIDTQFSRSQSPQLPSPRGQSPLEAHKLNSGAAKLTSVGDRVGW